MTPPATGSHQERKVRNQEKRKIKSREVSNSECSECIEKAEKCHTMWERKGVMN